MSDFPPEKPGWHSQVNTMPNTNTLSELLSTLLVSRPFRRRTEDGRPISELCSTLLEKSEVSGRQLAEAILNKYASLSSEEQTEFFTYLNNDLDIDGTAISELAAQYSKDRSVAIFKSLAAASEPPRQEVFRRLNQAPNATTELVRMRSDLLAMLKTYPEFARTDFDFVHLLKSWFNQGFLVLRQITWDSPASVLEKIIAYEAVHEIRTWEDLRRRLHPTDRRCFAFFHPAMPDDPLIFVEVALTNGVPDSIQQVLSDDREVFPEEETDTAVFYSISNCQTGLAGISFGDSLIKQVARSLSQELPALKTFVTLSPIPGLVPWLKSQGLDEAEHEGEKLRQLAAYYLLEAKNTGDRPLDPVARFHLGNGALIHAVHPGADTSEKGLSQSRGAMVNYLYDLNRISQNVQALNDNGVVASSGSVRSLAKQADKWRQSDQN